MIPSSNTNCSTQKFKVFLNSAFFNIVTYKAHENLMMNWDKAVLQGSKLPYDLCKHFLSSTISKLMHYCRQGSICTIRHTFLILSKPKSILHLSKFPCEIDVDGVKRLSVFNRKTLEQQWLQQPWPPH